MGGVTPDDISNLQLWLQADSINQADATAVSTWSDDSGNGNDATQGTAAAQPTFHTNVINGLPIVRFDGTDDLFTLGNVLDVTGDLSIFTVCDFDVSGSNDTFGGKRDGTGATPWAFRSGTGDELEFYINDGGGFEVMTADTALAINTFVIGDVVRSGTSVSFELDGAADGTRTQTKTPAGNTVAAGVGSHTGGSAGELRDGDIAEFIFYDRALTGAERGDVQSYLSDKYGIAVA